MQGTETGGLRFGNQSINQPIDIEFRPDFGCHFRKNVRRWSFVSPYSRAVNLTDLTDLEIEVATLGVKTNSQRHENNAGAKELVVISTQEV